MDQAVAFETKIARPRQYSISTETFQMVSFNIIGGLSDHQRKPVGQVGFI